MKTFKIRLDKFFKLKFYWFPKVILKFILPYC